MASKSRIIYNTAGEKIVDWGFHLRVTETELDILKAAAQREGRSLSNYARYHTLEAARKSIGPSEVKGNEHS